MLCVYIYNSISIYIYCCCWINSTFYQSLAGSSLHISKTWQVPRISILTQPLWIRVAPDVPGPPWSWWVPGRTVSPSSRVRAIAGWCGQSRSRWASRSCPSCWSHGSWRITGIESEKMCLDMKISEDLGYDIIWYTYVSCFVKSDNQLRQVVCNKTLAVGQPAQPAQPHLALLPTKVQVQTVGAHRQRRPREFGATGTPPGQPQQQGGSLATSE